MSDEHSQESVHLGSRRKLLTGMGVAAAGVGMLAVAGGQSAAAAVDRGTYYSVTPERVLDTRRLGGRISSGRTRTENVLAGDGFAAVCNVTVVNTAGSGYLSIFNADGARPTPYSNLNWWGARQVLANVTIIELGEAGFSVYCGGGSTDFLIDLLGFFETPPAAARSARAKQFEESVRRKLAQRR